MKKLSKRIYAFLLTAIMILTMIPTVAFAAEGDVVQKQSITINGTEAEDLAGRTFNVYQVFTANYTGGVFVDYAVASEFESFFAAIAKEEGTDDFDAVAYVEGLRSDATSVQNFAKELARYVRNNNTAAAGTIQPTDVKGSNKLVDLALGYYFIDEPAAIEGSAAMLGALQKDLDAVFTVKSEKPTVEKKIVEDDENKDVTDAKIGDTITFTLKSRIPANAGSFENDYWFEFRDTLSTGLTFGGADSVFVSIDGTTAGAADYTVEAEDQTFNVKIASDIAKANAGREVVVTYTAVLNENAVIGGNGNTNDVTVEYSNNPYWDGTGENPPTSETEPDTVVVFTLQGNGTKVDAADDTKVLGGAEFELYSTETMDKDSRIYVKAENAENGIYVITKDADDITADTKVTSTAAGLFSIKGLKEGTYFLKETKAPDGYNLLKNPIKLVVTPEYGLDADGKTVVTKLEVTIENSSANIVGEPNTAGGSFDYTVKNTSGPTLPETGGIGTYIFTFGGLILMIAAAALLFFSKKKAAHK